MAIFGHGIRFENRNPGALFELRRRVLVPIAKDYSMPSAIPNDKLAAIDAILSKPRIPQSKKSSFFLTSISAGTILCAVAVLGFCFGSQATSMTATQAIIALNLVEEIAEKRGEPLDRIWSRLEADMGFSNPAEMTFRQGRMVIDALAADLGREVQHHAPVWSRSPPASDRKLGSRSPAPAAAITRN